MSITSRTTSRRALAGGAAASALAAGLATSATAAAGAAYPPGYFRGSTPLLSTRQRHLVGRFSYGVTPALAQEVRRAGGARRWFDDQLAPAKIKDKQADRLLDWWSGLSRPPAELWLRTRTEVEPGWQVMLDYQRWVLMRRMRSRRQLLEVMTEFWENHFNVPVNGDAQFTWRKDYGDKIRANALGRFEDLLQATTTHPAMLIYLDNVSSTKEHPNENLGRELLELHTVGRGAYTEDDVKDSARILTGWSVDMWSTFAAAYNQKAHDRHPVSVLEFTAKNAAADGRPVTRAYLSYLARHPATAQRIAHKLAVKFVRDDPPAALVGRLAQIYLDHDTEIRPVLRALVDSSAFATSVGTKVRDPGEDLVATYRALGVAIARPPVTATGERYAANSMLWQVAAMGTKPFDWPRPDGQPIDNSSWSTPSRLMASMSNHYVMSGGWWPKDGLDYRTVDDWFPSFPIRFDKLVDHLSQELLHRRSTSVLLQACCEAVAAVPKDTITREHAVARWNFPRLLTTVLDSPDFLTR